MRLPFAAVVLLASSSALAGPAWIAPEDYTPGVNEEVDVLHVKGRGFSGQRVMRRNADLRNVWIRDSETRDVTSAGTDGAPAITRLTNGEDRGVMIAYRSTLSRSAMEADPFEEYLRLHGLDGVRRQRELFGATWPGKEQREQAGKSWIQGAENWRHKEPMGLPLEIVPRRDPALVESLEVEVLWQGRPLPNAMIKSWRQNLGEGGLPKSPEARLEQPTCEVLRTNRYGRARLDVDARAEYLVACMHSVPGRDRTDLGRSWETHATSLSFARGGAYKDDDGDRPRGWRQGHGEDRAIPAQSDRKATRRDRLGR